MNRIKAHKSLIPPNGISWAVFGILILIIILREPAYFIAPRFWAEEGTLYFASSLNTPWYQFLFSAHPSFPYYSFINNFAALASSRLVSLEHAPAITTWIAFLITLIPFAIILWGDSTLFKSAYKKYFAICVILITAANQEIWLNSTNSPVYLLIVVILLLFEEFEDKGLLRRLIYHGILIISTFSSIMSIFLAPVFLYKAWIKGQKDSIIQAVIILLAGFVQFSIFIFRLDTLWSTEKRFLPLTIGEAGFIFLSRIVIDPLTGSDYATNFGDRIVEGYAKSHSQMEIAGILLAVLFIVGFVLIWFRYKKIRNILMMLQACFIFLFVFSTYTALVPDSKLILIYPISAPRYFVVPIIIFQFILLSYSKFSYTFWKKDIFSFLSTGFLALTLLSGLLSYRSEVSWDTEMPIWIEEVDKYREDHSYRQLQIWPSGWTVRLE